MPTISEIKRDARRMLSAAAPSAFIAVILYLLVAAALNYVAGLVGGAATVGDAALDLLGGEAYIRDGWTVTYMDSFTVERISAVGAAISILLSLVMSVLSTGMTWYYLRVSRGEKPRAAEIFSVFRMFTPVLALNVVMWVFVGLWSLLLVIPGIIAALRYSQAAYIMFDNPGMTPMECIRESKTMMRGNKWEYFLLGLSFIGWMLLGGLVDGLLSNILFGFSVSSILITPYMYVSFAVYYNHLSGRRIAEI